MVSFRPIVINILLVTLFVIALIMGGIMMSTQNDAPQSIENDTIYAGLKDSLIGNVTQADADTRGASGSFENSSVSLTSGIPFINSIYGTWKVIKTAPLIMYNMIVGVIFHTLLGDTTTAIVTAVLSIILLITIIFAIVKLVSTGDGG